MRAIKYRYLYIIPPTYKNKSLNIRVGVQDKFGCSGPAWDLLKEYGLDAATICKTAHKMLNK